MDQQNRVFLAVALSIGVLIFWSYFFSPDPPPPDPNQQTAQQTDNTDPQKTAANPPNTDAANPAAKTDVPAPKKIDQKDVVIETEAFRAVLTNRGGRLKSFLVKAPEQYARRGDLLHPVLEDEEQTYEIDQAFLNHLPFGTAFAKRKAAMNEQAMYEVVREEKTGLLFRYTDPQGRFTLDKLYTRTPEDPKFSFQLAVTLTNNQETWSDQLQLVVHADEPTDAGERSFLNPVSNAFQTICYTDGDVERIVKDDALEKPSFPGPVAWGGVESPYFMTSLIAKDNPLAGCRMGPTKAWNFQVWLSPLARVN